MLAFAFKIIFYAVKKVNFPQFSTFCSQGSKRGLNQGSKRGLNQELKKDVLMKDPKGASRF